jgi:predicted GNAT family N-acyltransferase
MARPVVTVDVGDWSALGEEARAIRTAVFVEEQKIAVEIERDAEDATAVHAVARNRLGLAVGTGRLLAGQGGQPPRIGRMAVRRDLRGGQVGRAVLEALMQHAGARGEREVMLHAQVGALAFYLRAGFVRHGPSSRRRGSSTRRCGARPEDAVSRAGTARGVKFCHPLGWC